MVACDGKMQFLGSLPNTKGNMLWVCYMHAKIEGEYGYIDCKSI